MTEVLDLWRSFCAEELDSGGPDSHMQMAVRAAQGDPWKVGCYIAPYSPVTAAVFWTRFPTAAGALAAPDDVHEFCRKYKPGLIVRKDRRSVLNPDNLADCFLSVATWTLEELPRLQSLDQAARLHENPDPAVPGVLFEEYWKSVNTVQHVGRYMAQKYLEGLRRAGHLQAAQPDVRPRDAKYVRRGIDLLAGRPKDDPFNCENATNRQLHLEWINSSAAWAGTYLDREVSWFQLEVLLCNFRQGLNGRYPGRTQDSDQVAYEKALAFWGDKYMTYAMDFYALRAELFPARFLAEATGRPVGVQKDKVEEWKAIGRRLRGNALADS